MAGSRIKYLCTKRSASKYLEAKQKDFRSSILSFACYVSEILMTVYLVDRCPLIINFRQIDGEVAKDRTNWWSTAHAHFSVV